MTENLGNQNLLLPYVQVEGKGLLLGIRKDGVFYHPILPEVTGSMADRTSSEYKKADKYIPTRVLLLPTHVPVGLQQNDRYDEVLAKSVKKARNSLTFKLFGERDKTGNSTDVFYVIVDKFGIRVLDDNNYPKRPIPEVERMVIQGFMEYMKSSEGKELIREHSNIQEKKELDIQILKYLGQNI